MSSPTDPAGPADDTKNYTEDVKLCRHGKVAIIHAPFTKCCACGEVPELGLLYTCIEDLEPNILKFKSQTAYDDYGRSFSDSESMTLGPRGADKWYGSQMDVRRKMISDGVKTPAQVTQMLKTHHAVGYSIFPLQLSIVLTCS
jgi:hypothetical protein